MTGTMPDDEFFGGEPADDEDEEQGTTRLPVWRSGLIQNAQGATKNLEFNLMQVLSRHPDWEGTVAFNQFTSCLTATRQTPFDPPGLTYPRKWTDTDTVKTMAWLQVTKRVRIEAKRSTADHALDAVGSVNAYHPPRDYLDSLRWDGVRRVPTWLSTYLGAEQSEFVERAGAIWLVSGIARIREPGCQADYMLILEGKQGSGKSTALRALFGEDWFTSSKLALGTDEACKKLQGRWGVEISELEGFRGRAWSEIKQFTTETNDHYRESYGRRVLDHPRTCIFAGTTNENEYLGDRTGNRRFWPVRCGTISVATLKRDRNQIWAEADEMYKGGAPRFMTDEGLARAEQRKREIREPWFDIVSAWLEHPSVPDGNGRRAIALSDGFTQADLLSGALSLRPNDMTPQAQQRAGWILSKLGYVRRRPRAESGERVYRYFPPGS